MGLCLMILDFMLIIGVICFKNLFLNIGYGILGWIMVCGLGKFISDLVMNY